jgi:hypothetical protein
MPGFGPAAEILLFRQKDPITVALFETHHATVTPRPASFNGTDANFWRADQLAALKQGPPNNKSVHPAGRAAGVEKKGKNISGLRDIHGGFHGFGLGCRRRSSISQ